MKKLLSIFFLSAVLVLKTQATTFSDVPKNHQYYKAIKELANEEIIGGYEDQTFKPGKVINRAEFLKIAIGAKIGEEEISKLVAGSQKNDEDDEVENEIEEDESEDLTTSSDTKNTLNPSYQGDLKDCFKDVKDEWFAPYVCFAKEEGWVGGYTDGTFKPGNNINFGEAFAIMSRIFELDVEEFDSTSWYYPYQRYFDIFDFVGNIEQSIAFQVNRGEMANLVYQVQNHLEDLDEDEIKAKIDEQKKMEELKIQVFHLVNEERKKQGRGELTYNIQLEKTAQMHAEDMVNRNFFAHVNPDGIDVMERVKTYKYDQRDVGENIALGQETPEKVMENWMNSPPHRENLLKANFTEMGVGIIENPEEGYSWVQVFGKPCEERDNMIGCTTRSDYQERNAEDENESNRWESPFTWY